MSSRRKKNVTAPGESVPATPLRWTKRAEADLASIYEYIARDNPIAAERWVEKLMEQAKLAAAAPQSGRTVPEIGRSDIREVFVRSYRIVYRIHAEAVHVITIFEGHRRFPLDVDPDDVIE